MMELGSYLGYSTSHFSRLFRKVIAVDGVKEFLEMNQRLNKNSTNIEYVPFQTSRDKWSVFDKYGKIDVVFIDAGHLLQDVYNDINHLLNMKRKPDIFIFDDYAAELGVRVAVDTYIDFDILMCGIPIGEDTGYMLNYGKKLWGPEAILCTTQKFDWLEDIRIKMERNGRKIEPRSKTRREAFDHALLHQTVPDHDMDYNTMTREVQDDLRRFLHAAQRDAGRNFTVLEIGSYVGYATSIIAPLVKKVVTVDMMPQLLALSKLFNERHQNIDYILLDTHEGDWSVMDKYKFDIVLFDGGLHIEFVIDDIWKVLHLKHFPSILIFDHYAHGAISEVVDSFEHIGVLKCEMGLGRPAEQGKIQRPDQREALVCYTTGLLPQMNPFVMD